jgi:Zn-dependent peptidase ImmA (M78 family)
MKERKPFKFKNAKGVVFEVHFRKPDKRYNAVGLCFDPEMAKHGETPKIYISPHLSDQVELNTIIHEFAHAFFWDRPEAKVAKLADALSHFIYTERGWRKEK